MERNLQEDTKAHLMQTSSEFRELASQHQHFEILVHQLEAKPYLTQEEEVEEHRLKKLKLHLKDQMEDMLHHSQAT